MGFIEHLMEKAKEAIFGKRETRMYRGHAIRPSSEDPYGDPADQMSRSRMSSPRGFSNVRPASEDPMGDPADQMRGSMKHSSSLSQGRFGNVKPASEDPMGDPGDQSWRR